MQYKGCVRVRGDATLRLGPPVSKVTSLLAFTPVVNLTRVPVRNLPEGAWPGQGMVARAVFTATISSQYL
jgi:hypothetical protein